MGYPTMVQSGMQPHRGSLILTLAIVGLFIFGPILGGIAWYLANQDLQAMQMGQMDPSGQGTTSTGRIIGIIDIALWVVGIVVWIGIMGVFGVAAAAHH